MRSALQNLERQ